MPSSTDEPLPDTAPFRRALGQRIATATAKLRTKSAAADAAGVSVEQLNRWIAGTVKVPVEGLHRLSSISNVDFCWLCTGRDPAATPLHQPGRVIQEAALTDVLTALATVMADEGVTFRPEKFAPLVLMLHDHLIDRRATAGAGADLGELSKLVRLAAR